jgi:hypothetical protein
MLGLLPTLKILILSQNKIETLLFPTDISQKKGFNGCPVTIFSSSLIIRDLKF